jgi:hypothetical protein
MAGLPGTAADRIRRNRGQGAFKPSRADMSCQPLAGQVAGGPRLPRGVGWKRQVDEPPSMLVSLVNSAGCQAIEARGIPNGAGGMVQRTRTGTSSGTGNSMALSIQRDPVLAARINPQDGAWRRSTSPSGCGQYDLKGGKGAFHARRIAPLFFFLLLRSRPATDRPLARYIAQCARRFRPRWHPPVKRRWRYG